MASTIDRSLNSAQTKLCEESTNSEPQIIDTTLVGVFSSSDSAPAASKSHYAGSGLEHFMSTTDLDAVGSRMLLMKHSDGQVDLVLCSAVAEKAHCSCESCLFAISQTSVVVEAETTLDVLHEEEIEAFFDSDEDDGGINLGKAEMVLYQHPGGAWDMVISQPSTSSSEGSDDEQGLGRAAPSSPAAAQRSSTTAHKPATSTRADSATSSPPAMPNRIKHKRDEQSNADEASLITPYKPETKRKKTNGSAPKIKAAASKEPATPTGPGKRKRGAANVGEDHGITAPNKPETKRRRASSVMTEEEQLQRIAELKTLLAAFDKPAGAGAVDLAGGKGDDAAVDSIECAPAADFAGAEHALPDDRAADLDGEAAGDAQVGRAKGKSRAKAAAKRCARKGERA